MKKLLFLAMIFASVCLSAQEEFTKIFTRMMYVKTGEDSPSVEFPSKVIYNYGNQNYLSITMGNDNYIYEVVGEITSGHDKDFGNYEQFAVQDEDKKILIIRNYYRAIYIYDGERKACAVLYNLK